MEDSLICVCLEKLELIPRLKGIVIKDTKLGYLSLKAHNNIFLIQKGVFNEFEIYNESGLVTEVIPGFNIYNARKLGNNFLLPNKLTKTHHILRTDDLFFIDLGFAIRHQLIHNNLFYHYGGVDQVSCFNIENQLLWKTDITSYGEWKTIDGTIEKNKREYNAFPCKDLILVPMKGRQLLALDAVDGSFRWMWTRDRGGKYGTDGSFLFNHDGLSLNRIDPSSGKLTHRIVHNDVLIGKDFYSASPVWVRSKYVILNETTTGKVAVFNKDNLALVKYFTFDGKIAHADSVVEAIEDTLYILDMDHNLRIIDLTK